MSLDTLSLIIFVLDNTDFSTFHVKSLCSKKIFGSAIICFFGMPWFGTQPCVLVIMQSSSLRNTFWYNKSGQKCQSPTSSCSVLLMPHFHFHDWGVPLVVHLKLFKCKSHFKHNVLQIYLYTYSTHNRLITPTKSIYSA